MSSLTHSMFIAGLLAANACAGSHIQSSIGRVEPVECEGGAVHTAVEASRYRGCTRVRGDLRIEGSELFELSDFGSIDEISGALVIARNPVLEDLDELQGLRSVARLEIRQNPELDSVAGLRALRTCQKLLISQNPALRSLSGLDGLEQVDRLVLHKNGLYRVTGLSGLREVGDLVVSKNGYLISLSGLSRLTRARSIHINANPRLWAASGLFSGLTEVESKLELTKNRGLLTSEILALKARVKLGPRIASVVWANPVSPVQPFILGQDGI